MSVSRLLRIPEACSLLGMGVTKFYAEVQRGSLAIVKNGRSTFVDEDEIKRYRSTLKVVSGSVARAGEAA